MSRLGEAWLETRLFGGFKLIRQAETSECGLACLTMIANHYGGGLDVGALRREYETSARGSTARDLAITADRLGMSTRTVRCELDDLPKLRLPAILHWNLGHYVVLYKVRGRTLHIADPAGGLQTYDLVQVSPHFTGIAIELAPTPRFERKRAERSMSVRKLVRWSPNLTVAFGQAMVLSLLLQAALLAVPIYLQLVIDESLQRGDRDILTVLLLGVLAVTGFAALATLLRGLTVQFMTQMLAFDMSSAVFHHMVRLPLNYFQKRQIGDIQQRFRSLLPVQHALGSGAVTGLIDGLLSLGAIALMAIYSPKLTLVALAFVGVTVLVRLASISATRNAASAALVAEAREQSRFLETLRAVATIKVNAAEPAREDLWRGNAAATINAQIQRGNITQVTQALNQTVTGVSDAVIIFLGARMALAGDMTVGVLTAFLAYKMQFSSRIAALVDQLIVFALLDVQLERVGDIALAPREDQIDDERNDGKSIIGAVELKDVSFRYSNFDPLVLQNVNLKVEPGEFVAITGRSGGGKSTLLRLLVGLAQPSSGSVLIDDLPMAAWGPRAIREQVSFVMQDDQLLAGTILDNITLFAGAPDLERVRWAARTAGIDDDIAGLPMGYASLIGDMGSLLSGGQRQRLMIARALYRRPRILIMDEGTSHLDLGREAKINAALREMDITRIVVAHRPETIRAADKMFILADRSLRAAA